MEVPPLIRGCKFRILHRPTSKTPLKVLIHNQVTSHGKPKLNLERWYKNRPTLKTSLSSKTRR
jgi:hypothetical protein